jgi:hypothetical protein
MTAIDLTPAVLGEDGITLKLGREFELRITVKYDHGPDLVRVHMEDPVSGNSADRAVTNGMIKIGDGVKMPIRAIYDMLPSAIEEIVVMNRLLGDVVQAPAPDFDREEEGV